VVAESYEEKQKKGRIKRKLTRGRRESNTRVGGIFREKYQGRKASKRCLQKEKRPPRPG